MRIGRAVCGAQTAPASASTAPRSHRHLRCMSRLHERPAADVEIPGHGDVHEAAHVAKRARDVALAGQVLGENEVAGPADTAPPFARLELEDARGEEDELPPRRVVQALHVALARLAKEKAAAREGVRRGPVGAAHRHFADLDGGIPGVLREYPEYAHAGRPRPPP